MEVASGAWVGQDRLVLLTKLSPAVAALVVCAPASASRSPESEVDLGVSGQRFLQLRTEYIGGVAGESEQPLGAMAA